MQQGATPTFSVLKSEDWLRYLSSRRWILCMLTYTDVCWRMQFAPMDTLYADVYSVCWCMLMYADVCWRMQFAPIDTLYADVYFVCCRILTYADVCSSRRSILCFRCQTPSCIRSSWHSWMRIRTSSRTFGTQFTCFTGTKVQILRLEAPQDEELPADLQGRTLSGRFVPQVP